MAATAQPIGEMVMKSNSELQHDVQNELYWAHTVTAANIGVVAHEGVITLTGDVPSYFEKVEAEHVARRVAGVMAIAQEIKVRLPAFSERTDTEVAQAALSALAWNVAVPRGQAQVLVENSWVTLTGQMDWYFQKVAAAEAVQHLMGVKGVTNSITLTPRQVADATEIKTGIEDAFERNAMLAAHTIRVTVQEDQVSLQGQVHFWEEKEVALKSAWAAPGVADVEDNIVVTY
jgi:osmotically-inducible protein OsmY